MVKVNIIELDIKSLQSELCNQFAIKKVEHGLVVNTGIIFVGGDSVQVLISDHKTGYLVSDQSSAAVYLESHGISIGSKLQHNFSKHAQRYGCGYVGNRVERTCSAEQLPVAILMVANASRLIGDYVLEIRRQVDKEFKRAVTDKLREAVGSRMRQQESVVGHSGRTWHIDNLVLDAQLIRPIAFIETVSNRKVVDKRVATFLDLSNKYKNELKQAVIKEESDLRQEDYQLLKGTCSDVVPFKDSKKKFEKIDAEAA